MTLLPEVLTNWLTLYGYNAYETVPSTVSRLNRVGVWVTICSKGPLGRGLPFHDLRIDQSDEVLMRELMELLK